MQIVWLSILSSSFSKFTLGTTKINLHIKHPYIIVISRFLEENCFFQWNGLTHSLPLVVWDDFPLWIYFSPVSLVVKTSSWGGFVLANSRAQWISLALPVFTVFWPNPVRAPTGSRNLYLPETDSMGSLPLEVFLLYWCFFSRRLIGGPLCPLDEYGSPPGWLPVAHFSLSFLRSGRLDPQALAAKPQL